jgi:hypothetical protein
MVKEYVKQNVESDASSPEQALSQAGQTTGARQPRSRQLATNDPPTPKGYTKLGVGGFPRDGKPHATENRGEGGA